MLRRGGSRVPRTGREESAPLSDPRQIAVRAMYKTAENEHRRQAPSGTFWPCNSSLPLKTGPGFKPMPADSFLQAKGDSNRCPSSERGQNLGSSAGAVPERGGRTPMTAREIAEALVADKALRPPETSHAAKLAALRRRDGQTVVSEGAPAPIEPRLRSDGGLRRPCTLKTATENSRSP
jgi:hypothetical protein